MSVLEQSIAFYQDQETVEGVTLCGSMRQGNADHLSDIDLWVFVSNDADISEQLAVSHYLPPFAVQEQLHEGRDDTLLPYITINAATADGVLNVKVLRLSELSNFLTRPASLDEVYLEDLENYSTMQILLDRSGALRLHQQMLEHTALRAVADTLVPEIISRYASLFWRSFYQGVYRSEQHPWKSLIQRMTELLCFIAFMKQDRLPPPRKWLYSDAMLSSLPEGPLFHQILTDVDAVHVLNKADTTAFYARLLELERAVLNHEYLHYDFWWHGVFLKRPDNINVDEGIRSLIAERLIHPLQKGA